MPRQSKSPLKVRENESACPEEKEEASFPLPKDQKICKVTKPKGSRASKKENLSNGTQRGPRKRALKYPKQLVEELSQPRGHPGGCFGALQGDVGTEPTLPLGRRGNVPCSRSVSLGTDFRLALVGGRAGGKPEVGVSEEQREEPADFAAGTIADFGIAAGSFGDPCKENSPSLLKFRRRSTIGIRGSPENNTLIQFLAQERSNRQREAGTEVSPFKDGDVRPLKGRIEAFQTFLESLQEAEEETGLSGLSHLAEASQEGASSQNKVPLKKEPNLEQWRGKFLLDKSGADLRANVSENVTKTSKSEPRTCSILSAPAAPQEWVSEQQNPPESLGTVVTGELLETGHAGRSELSPAATRSDVLSGPSRKQVGFGEEPNLGVLDGSKALVTPPVTPRQNGGCPFNGLPRSGSLTSILKKTPKKQLLDSPKEYLSVADDGGGGGESVPASSEKAFEASETDTTESLNFTTPKKKKVTFGEVLSPEIFDQSLPANTPLRRGACPGLSPSPAHPLPSLHCHWHPEHVEPLQELLEDPVPAEDPSPAEAQTDKPDTAKAPSPKRRCRAKAEEPESSLGSTGNAEGTRNPRKSKIQGQKNPSTSKRTQKTRQTGNGKRRKRRVRRSLYGARELASKKPLLSPIPEIPEVFSSVSSPDSPKAYPLFSEGAVLDSPKSRHAWKDIQEKAKGMRGKNIWVSPSPEDLELTAPGRSRGGTFQHSGAGTDHEFSNIVPDAEDYFNTSEYFQQVKETACENEAKESSSLIENKQLQGNLLTGLEFLEQQAKDVHEGAQGTLCPQTDSAKGIPARRRRRRSDTYFPHAENLKITGIDLPVSSYNVEEFLSVPAGSLQLPGGRSSSSGEVRVRRSMRLSRAPGAGGLAWIQLPVEAPEQPPLPGSALRRSRRISTSILAGAGNIHPRVQNPVVFSALGKENEDSAHLAGGSCRRQRRRSSATPQEAPGAQTKKRRISNSVNKDRNHQKQPEKAEIPLEGVTPGEVSAVADFLK
ncbi:cell division cycle-associated protein 2 [Pithys albifrons albifrons]|uniref:cell division cycle-associated protein 2 n=1 Tax=Pithys albifrons albifrons TaxID=3385563 RepID=UPI003A5CD53E